jgi:hypothetical protein
MTLSFPRTMPASLRTIQKISWRAYNVNASSTSPFTLTSQTIHYGACSWQADCTLPRMRAAQAEEWLGFLLSLKGKLGSFLLWDPARSTPRGTITAGLLTATSGSDEGTFSAVTGNLEIGDLFQLGTGATATLHKMITARSGNGTGTFWPHVRRNITAEPLVLQKPCGVFQLASNITEWDVDAVAAYGLSFSVQELIQ